MNWEASKAESRSFARKRRSLYRDAHVDAENKGTWQLQTNTRFELSNLRLFVQECVCEEAMQKKSRSLHGFYDHDLHL